MSDNSLHKALWVVNIGYFRLETALLAAARRKGCRVMVGSGMAVGQAAGAYALFTGQRPDVDRMREAFFSLDT